MKNNYDKKGDCFWAAATSGYAVPKDGIVFPEEIVKKVQDLLPHATVDIDKWIDFDGGCDEELFREEIEDTLSDLVPYIQRGYLALDDSDSVYHKWEYENGSWQEYEREWCKVEKKPQRIEIPLSDGNKLVAEENPDPEGYKEIFIGLETKEGWIQDLAVVGEQYSYGDYCDVVPNSGNYRVLVYGDENSDDYTEEIPIRIHREAEE